MSSRGYSYGWRISAIVLWLVFGLYFGIGGWTRVALEEDIARLLDQSSQDGTPVVLEGVEFADLSDAMVFLEKRRAEKIFPWIHLLPSFAGLFLAAAGFGALGAITRQMKHLVVDHWSLLQLHVIAGPLLGFLLGLALLGVAYVIPVALASGEDVQPRPATLLVLCLIGGLFPARLYEWFENLFRRRFQTATKETIDE